MIDLLAYSLNSTILTNLPDDKLVRLTLSKWQGLINRLRAVRDDVLKLEWPKLLPSFFNSSKSNTWSVVISVDCSHVKFLILIAIKSHGFTHHVWSEGWVKDVVLRSSH